MCTPPIYLDAVKGPILAAAFMQVATGGILPSNFPLVGKPPSLRDDNNETLLVTVGGFNGNDVVADVAIYSLTSNSQQDNGAPSPNPLEAFGSAIFNDTIYIINGDDNNTVQNSFWSYNVGLNKWNSNLPPVPAATAGSQAVELGGRIYVLGGLTDLHTRDFNSQVFAYSTRLRKWYTLNTTIPQTDINPCAVVQEQHLYYLPAGSLYHSDDGADTWQTLAAPATNRTAPACVAVGMDAIMLIGGLDETQFFNSAEIYNITTNQWKTVSTMGTARGGAWAVVIPGKDNNNDVLICGGATSETEVLKTCEIYDWQNDMWTMAPYTLDQPRADFGLFVLPPVQ